MRDAYSYQAVLAASERVCFRIDDVLPEDAALDFERRFLPDALAGTSRHTGLSALERLRLNQIYGHTYLSLFGLVEEFILPFILEHARSELGKADDATRAMLGFASEEAKHIALFKRFRATFERGYGTSLELAGSAQAIREAVLAHRPLGVALIILHIEWLTQRHYIESVRSDEQLEPRIKELLKQHWLEEAQHAKLDTLLTESIASRLAPADVEAGVDDYLHIVAAFEGLLAQQSALDLSALEALRGRPFSERERPRLVREHARALEATFLRSGMTHPNFLSTLHRISPRGAERVLVRAIALEAA